MERMELNNGKIMEEWNLTMENLYNKCDL